MGALALNDQKYRSSHCKCPKCGSAHYKHSKGRELSLYTTRSVGGLALNMQEYGSSRFSTHKVLPHMIEPKIVKKGRFKHPRQAGFGSHFF